MNQLGVWCALMGLVTIASGEGGYVLLYGDSTPGQGNVYVDNSDNVMGPVCDSNWGEAEAKVVCRQLGYANGFATTKSTFGRVNNDFVMYEIKCAGDEARIQDCQYETDEECGEDEGAGVRCTNSLGTVTSASPGCMTTPSRPDLNGKPSIGNTPCVFPFKLRGKTYFSCAPGTVTYSNRDDESWCSTKVDSYGKHVKGHWGFCSESCSVNCTSSEFSCVNRNECIEAERKCDGVKDCQDESDEGSATCGCFGGISCCSQGFTSGDNNGDDGEYFIQAFEYLTNCEVSCKTKYPTEAIGVTESLVDTYTSGDGKNKKKCWCEFGAPKLDSSNANFQTCIFSKVQGGLGYRWKFNRESIKYLAVNSVGPLRGGWKFNESECCELCRKDHPTTEFFEIEFKPFTNCVCYEPIPDVQQTTYYQDYFTQYCGANSSFEAGVEGGLGDGRKVEVPIRDRGSLRQYSVSGDDVHDKSECCERCNKMEDFDCDLILHQKSPWWEACWYYKSTPGQKLKTHELLDEFIYSGSCGISVTTISTPTTSTTTTSTPGSPTGDCNGGIHGIPCCPHYVEGDMVGNDEIEISFSPKTEVGCQNSCKAIFPTSIGVTQDPDGTSSCFCEFGSPKVGGRADAWKTCMFSAGATSG